MVSPELKLVIQSSQNDPRFGQTTFTLKNIQQGQPDETLFQVPADYKVNKIVPRLASPYSGSGFANAPRPRGFLDRRA